MRDLARCTAIIGTIPTIDPEAGELGESTLVDRINAIGGLNQTSDGAVGKAELRSREMYEYE